MQLAEIVATSARVRSSGSRLQKIEHLAGALRRLAPDEVELGVGFLAGDPPLGRVGIGPRLLREAQPGSAAAQPELALNTVGELLEQLAATRGAGSGAARERLLHDLLVRATAAEQHFLRRLLLGELRQGALEGLMVEAVARAAALPVKRVRRALMLAGDIRTVGQAALTAGGPGLERFGVEIFRPLKPMLAGTAEAVADPLSRWSCVAFDYKLDGARVQVHKRDDAVRVYSRRLNDVTEAVPEVVERVRALPARELILDGEVLALQPSGAPQPFQVTMRRFGRKIDVARAREQLPLTPFFFDCLALDGHDLLDEPAVQRFDALREALPAPLCIPRLVTGEASLAQSFAASALDRGHEGVIAKMLAAPYEAGARGSAWLKIKPAHTLDLVVLAAEWGHGRREGWLSNLHLGARDPAGGGFVMLGKTFKGLTDQILAWQTHKLLEIALARDPYAVYVRPELVVEVAFNDIQSSPRYPAGMALRFARVKRYRPDKRPADADSVDTVRAIHRAQSGGTSPPHDEAS